MIESELTKCTGGFEGILHCHRDLEWVLQARAHTLYGDFNNPSLEFRSTCSQKAEEYYKKLNESVDRLRNLKESIKSGSEASQHTHQIADILKFDIDREDPLSYIVQTSHGYAKELEEKGSHGASWPKILDTLWIQLICDKNVADLLLAAKERGTRRTEDDLGPN